MKTENFFGNSVHPLEKSDGMKIVLEELLSPVLVEGGLKKKKKKRDKALPAGNTLFLSCLFQ